MSERSPGGILAAVVTLFRADETIDDDSWRRVIDFLVAGGIDGSAMENYRKTSRAQLPARSNTGMTLGLGDCKVWSESSLS
jgi:hypothetical protein